MIHLLPGPIQGPVSQGVLAGCARGAPRTGDPAGMLSLSQSVPRHELHAAAEDAWSSGLNEKGHRIAQWPFSLHWATGPKALAAA